MVVTVLGLLTTLGILAGLFMCAFGTLEVFAGGMSDDVSAGASAGRSGCICGLLGLALIGGCIAALVL